MRVRTYSTDYRTRTRARDRLALNGTLSDAPPVLRLAHARWAERPTTCSGLVPSSGHASSCESVLYYPVPGESTWSQGSSLREASNHLNAPMSRNACKCRAARAYAFRLERNLGAESPNSGRGCDCPWIGPDGVRKDVDAAASRRTPDRLSLSPDEHRAADWAEQDAHEDPAHQEAHAVGDVEPGLLEIHRADEVAARETVRADSVNCKWTLAS
eukprot:6173168-Pleurochrysis_carterae.AAC.5